VRPRIALKTLPNTLVGAFFVVSGTLKLDLGGDRLNTLFATLIPDWRGRMVFSGLELALGAWLISGCQRAVARMAGIVVLLLLAGVLMGELSQDRPLPCGCSGVPLVLENVSNVRFDLRLSLLRNLLLAASLTLAGLTEASRRGSNKISEGGSHEPDALASATA
jgi:hypothetical protein